MRDSGSEPDPAVSRGWSSASPESESTELGSDCTPCSNEGSLVGEEEYEEEENTSSNAIQLADDAMNSAEFHQSDVQGLTLRCWDFGGQPEYEIAHELFISPRSILMLVFDLRRFEDDNTRDAEVRELCHWFQILFAITAEEDVKSTAESLLVVGTRRDMCKHSENVPDYFQKLKEELTELLDPGLTKSLNLFEIPCFAIENSKAKKSPQKSGLMAIEAHLDSVAKKIIQRSKEVPLRWLAFLESLRTDEMLPGIFVKHDKIMDRMGGLHFPPTDIDRIKELKAMLLYFRDLGEVVVFDLSRLTLTASSEDFVVFIHPEKILQALKVIVAPKRVRCEGLLGRKERERMHLGLLTHRVLEKKWRGLEGLSEASDRDVLVELLVSMDLFVKLDRNTLGVPALLKSGWETWGWIEAGSDRKEVAAVTTFENFVPFGLIGRLIARMYRTIGTENTDVQYVRSNAVLLTMGSDVTQVFMGFDNTARELHWKVRADSHNFQLLGRCLTVFEAHMRERINMQMCGFRHHFVTDCPKGCNKMKFRLMFDIPSLAKHRQTEEGDVEVAWWDVMDLDVESVSRLCKPALCRNGNCANVFRYTDAMTISVPSNKPGAVRTGVPDQYAAFISHAGTDKEWAVYLAEALERKCLRTFVDRLELICSSETGDELMEKAIQTARVGVFITSPEFFARRYTMHEMRTFLRRNETSDANEKVVIYPIFHRLSYNEASSGDLASHEQYAPLFREEGFFTEKRQDACSTQEALAAMQRMSRYPGLEKKLPELHNTVFRKHPWTYRGRMVWRSMCNAVNAQMGYELVDQELCGCTTAEMFDFAAERIAAAYHKTHTSADGG
ncbi:TIR domain-containing protein GTPase [Chondrus crispus]|uniref:TIR domain-containing protein GTPase n=1 Tax=Chondrus crispus TaxID=2769 RepID=R7QNN8_CHOCR|nr:TIR domain-containing protein GTPase [Chondrus crispus]CDF39398.1 TIR domain-containing protein GTPase [Chondrus crispus]|eukprot:XP_005719309.1 TIR domain-containing protein GTPase [Chondrus crispus]